MKIWTLTFFVLLVCINCKNEKPAKNQTPPPEIGILSQAQIQDLVAKVDFVDFLFYHMNISVSQNDLGSIRQSVQFLTPAAKLPAMQCPAIGRISFQSQGKIILEVDIHFATNCGYFTIIENKVSKGTSLMSPEGVKFLSTLINSYQPQ